jgi:DNA polymerase III subunit delta
MNKDFQKISDDIKARKFAEIYFLSGDEAYYIDEISNSIIENALDASQKDFNLHIFYGKESKANQIIEQCMRYPMFANHNLILVKEAQHLKELDFFIPYLKNGNPQTILVFCYKHKKADKRTRFYKALKEKALIFEGSRLYDNQIPEWIQNYLKSFHYTISEKATNLLVDHLGNDLSKIANELNKIISLKDSNTIIDDSDIEKYVGISKEYNVDEVKKAVINRDARKLVRIINYIRANPNAIPFPLIIGAFFSFFSRLMAVKYSREKAEDILRKKFYVNNYFVKDYLKAYKEYGNQLESIMEMIHEYDLKSKGVGVLNPQFSELAKEFLFRIISL